MSTQSKEYSLIDAPLHYNSNEANAWASGANSVNEARDAEIAKLTSDYKAMKHEQDMYYASLLESHKIECDILTTELGKCRDAMPSELDVVTRDYACGHPDGVADFVTECVKSMQSDIDALTSERNALLLRNAELVESLKEHGRHLPQCNFLHNWIDADCNCGLFKALANATSIELVEVGEVEYILSGTTADPDKKVRLKSELQAGTKLYIMKRE